MISMSNKNTTKNVGVCLKNYAVDVELGCDCPRRIEQINSLERRVDYLKMVRWFMGGWEAK